MMRGNGLVSFEVNELLQRMVNLPCTRVEVGSMRSISLGFGDESQDPKRRKRQYRAWEIGTYSGDWKVVNSEGALLAKNRSRSIRELDAMLKTLHFGKFVSIQQTSKSNVRINLDNGIVVDILGNLANDDEYFHIFGPESAYAELSASGWQVGRSDAPWHAQEDGAGLNSRT